MITATSTPIAQEMPTELRIADGLAPMPVRGICPSCGGPLVSNAYRVGRGRGYIIVWECFAAIVASALPGQCAYRKVV